MITLEDLSPEEIEVKQQELLEKVPQFEAIGNKTLREALGNEWNEDLYWAIRNRLIERGRLAAGKGKGGSVKKVSLETFPSNDTDFFEFEHKKEFSLYEPIASALRSHWSKEQGFDNCLVEVTAKQGAKPTGKWSRPDITVVGYKTFPYVPGRYFEVITFEIKPTNNIDVTAVYEALAHRRASTRAYVIVHIPNSQRADLESLLDAVGDESKRLGIGLIIADNPSNFDTWEVILDADRFEPDLNNLNEFIAQQASTELKEQVVRWFK